MDHRRKIDWLLGLLLALAVAGFLAMHPHLLTREVLEVVLAIALFVLFPAAYYWAARHLFSDSFPPRIRIQPFHVLDGDSRYDGRTIAAMLSRRIEKVLSGRGQKHAVSSSAKSLSINLGGATIPFEAVRDTFEKVAFGPQSVVEGVVVNHGDAVRVSATCREPNSFWDVRFTAVEGVDPLSPALDQLVNSILDALGLFEELAEKFVVECQYDLAIQKFEFVESAESTQRVAELYLFLGRPERTRATLVEGPVTDAGKREELLARADFAEGDYEGALARIADPLLEDSGRARALRAEILMCQGQLEMARHELEVACHELTEGLQGSVEAEDWSLHWLHTSDLIDARLQLIRCCKELGELEDAVEHVLVGLEEQRMRDEVYGADFDSILASALLSLESGETNSANRKYEKAYDEARSEYEMNPNNLGATMAMAWASSGRANCYRKQVIDQLSHNGRDREEVVVATQVVEWLLDLSVDQEDEDATSFLGDMARLARDAHEEGSELPEEWRDLDWSPVRRLLDEWGVERVEHMMRSMHEAASHHENAVHWFQRLAGGEGDHVRAEGWFGLACLHAIRDERDPALAALSLAILISGSQRNRARVDGDLRSIRDDPRFWSTVGWPGEDPPAALE